MSKPTSWKLLENASFLTCYTCARAKDFALTDVLGSLIPGDIFSKYHDRSMMEKHLVTLGLEFEKGLEDSAPEPTHAIYHP